MNKTDTGTARELPFRSLVAFEACARLGSVSRAADELHLTQSAVSQRLLKLEAHLGQRLFVRHGQGVRPTGAGELLLQTTRDTLQRLQAGLARIEPYRNKASLLLACPGDFAQGWLMPRLHGMKALHASLEVWMMSEQEVTAIDRIDVDLVVSRKPLHRPDVDCVPLLEDRSIAVCGPQTAARLAALPFPRLLDKAPLLFLESEPEWGGLLAAHTQRPARAARAQRVATIQDERLLLDAVENELGVAYLSQLLATQALARGRCVHLAQVPAAERARLWLMRSRLAPRTPIANRAFAWLLAQAGVAA